MQINTNHFLLTFEHDMKTICAPLMKSTPINYFHYYRHYLDGSFLELNTNALLIKKCFELDLIATDNELKKNNSHYVILSPNCDTPVAFDKQKCLQQINLLRNNGVTHQFYIIDPEDDFIESTCFGISRDPNFSINYFFNHIDLLEQFSSYFKDKAQDIIRQCSSNRLIKTFTDEIKIQESMNDIQIDLKFLYDLFKPSQISYHEKLAPPHGKTCLNQLTNGLIDKETTCGIEFPTRDPEARIANLRKKLSCKNIKQLAELYLRNNSIKLT